MPFSLQIGFDRPHAAYSAGETVNGLVTVTVDKPKDVQAITLQLQGEANVAWSESDSVRRTRTVLRRHYNSTTQQNQTRVETEWYNDYYTLFYSDTEMYIRTSVDLGGPGTVKLKPGVSYDFPFSLRLTSDLPSSFEGIHGHVRYTAKVTLHRPWKFNHSAKAAFTVLSDLDLNFSPQAKIPIEIEQTKTLCCWCCKSGPLTVTLRMPSSGFVPGQAMPVLIQADNASRTDIDDIVIRFVKEVSYNGTAQNRQFGSLAPYNKTKVTTTNVKKVSFGGVPAHDSKVISEAVVVPALPPSLLVHCSLMDIRYQLKIKTVIGGMHINMEDSMPVVVGTIPLRFVPDAPPSYDAPTASAPTASATPIEDLPPPSYEECFFRGNSIMDSNAGDDEYTLGPGDFTPRYPVWTIPEVEHQSGGS